MRWGVRLVAGVLVAAVLQPAARADVPPLMVPNPVYTTGQAWVAAGCPGREAYEHSDLNHRDSVLVGVRHLRGQFIVVTFRPFTDVAQLTGNSWRRLIADWAVVHSFCHYGYGPGDSGKVYTDAWEDNALFWNEFRIVIPVPMTAEWVLINNRAMAHILVSDWVPDR